MRGAEQHGLLFERSAHLAILQDRRHNALGLRGVVLDRHEAGFLAGDPVGTQVLGEALAGEPDHRVRGGEDRLGRAVVLFKRDNPGWGHELVGEVLPEPAPAITSSGPAILAPVDATPCSTAQRCASFRLVA
jgi:hypothetical protein